MSTFKEKLNDLSNDALDLSGVKEQYSDEDLSNGVLVLMEVFMNKMYDYHKDKLTQEQMTKLSEEAGKSIHQTMLLFTGVDLHKVYE